MSTWMPLWRITNGTDKMLSGIELHDHFEAVSDDITTPISVAPGTYFEFRAQPRADFASMFSLLDAIAARGLPTGKILSEGTVYVEDMSY